VFFNGCNLRCGFCHNPFLIFSFKETISQEDILNFLDTRKGLLDGVVLSGGEPCMDPSVVEFVKKIKDKGFLVKLDTNGCFPDVLEECLPYVDYVAMDIKSSLDNYSKVCGVEVDVSKIQKSVELVKDKGEFRTTVVPGLIDDNEIRKIGEWLKGAKKYVIQNFVSRDDHVDKKFVDMRSFQDSDLERFKKIASEYFTEIEIRNL